MRSGLECFLDAPQDILQGRRAALLTNPTAVTKDFSHAVDVLHAHQDVDLRLLLGPEHGVRATAQDMIKVGDESDPITNLPVVSLYGESFESLSPTPEALKDIDVLIFDIQDVGARYYTYAATLALAMKVCGPLGIEVIVLDRPNPIGGHLVEGCGVEPGYENFCGLFALPQRHGLTVGELAHLYVKAFGVECEVKVIKCEGWRRTQWFDQTDLPWVMPSPNMPTLDTATVYVGGCLIEGTLVSEARGTTRPFELIGASYIDPNALTERLRGYQLEGVIFRPTHFQPTFHKFGGENCGGVQLHVTERERFHSLNTGLAIIHAIRNLYPDAFKWRTEKYEFRDDVPAIDLLIGHPRFREAIEQGADLSSCLETVTGGLDAYNACRDSILLYTD